MQRILQRPRPNEPVAVTYRDVHLGSALVLYAGLYYEDERHEQGVPVTINHLSAELLIRHHSAVGLVDRLVAQGLVVRERVPDDRRKVRLRLTATGERVLARLASIHRQKLRRIGPDIHRMLGELAGAWGERR